MCDCWMCNQTQEEFDEGHLEWEYEQYLKDPNVKPLSMNEWLASLPKQKEE